MDKEKVKHDNSLSEIIGKDIALTQKGADHWGLCPFHDDKSASLRITDKKHFYYCHACGAKGDIIDYIMWRNNLNFKGAIELLNKGVTGDIKGIKIKKEWKDPTESYLPVIPVPKNTSLPAVKKKLIVFNPKYIGSEKETATYYPDMLHEYRLQNGTLYGYVLRKYLPLKKGQVKPDKITPPFMFCEHPDGTKMWTHRPFPEPRPLYRLHLLPEKGKQVFIAEGETSAEAFTRMTNLPCVSWCGGTNAIIKTDWSPLKDYLVTIWPDNDENGVKAGLEIAGILQQLGGEVKLLSPPGKTEVKGWDAGDALKQGWKREDVFKFIKNNRSIALAANNDVKADTKKSSAEKKAKKDKQEFINDQFNILGSSGEHYFYMPRQKQELVTLTAPHHSELNLYRIANYSYWRENYANNDGRINWKRVAESLIQLSDKKGYFNPMLMRRGRGAWLEKGQKIMHLGDRVIVNGDVFKPMDAPTKMIYEVAGSINITATEALSTAEAGKLIKLCEQFSWRNPLSGRLLAGWCVIAPICGVLDWRPHVWITGPAGTGKTTIMRYIVRNMLKNFNLEIDGKATEASIRQLLARDAMPVTFDEAETDNKGDSARLQAILDLARSASSGAKIPKGGGDGKPMLYIIRSMFCFSSINTSIKKYADETRLTKLETQRDTSHDVKGKYKKLKLETISTLTEEYASGMMLRAMQNVEVLLDNIKTFEEAAIMILSEDRYADQLAPLLAGAYLCESLERIDLASASKWIQNYDWGDHVAENVAKDHERLLEYILSWPQGFSEGGKRYEKTVGQMLYAIGRWQDTAELFKEHLRPRGIMVEEGRFFVATRGSALEKLLQDTAWSSSWASTLINVPGGKHDKVKSFGGYKTRTVSIPLSVLNYDDEVEKKEVILEEVKFEEYV